MNVLNFVNAGAGKPCPYPKGWPEPCDKNLNVTKDTGGSTGGCVQNKDVVLIFMPPTSVNGDPNLTGLTYLAPDNPGNVPNPTTLKMYDSTGMIGLQLIDVNATEASDKVYYGDTLMFSVVGAPDMYLSFDPYTLSFYDTLSDRSSYFNFQFISFSLNKKADRTIFQFSIQPGTSSKKKMNQVVQYGEQIILSPMYDPPVPNPLCSAFPTPQESPCNAPFECSKEYSCSPNSIYFHKDDDSILRGLLFNTSQYGTVNAPILGPGGSPWSDPCNPEWIGGPNLYIFKGIQTQQNRFVPTRACRKPSPCDGVCPSPPCVDGGCPQNEQCPQGLCRPVCKVVNGQAQWSCIAKPSNGGNGGKNTKDIIGYIVLGVIAVLVILVFVSIWRRRRAATAKQ